MSESDGFIVTFCVGSPCVKQTCLLLTLASNLLPHTHIIRVFASALFHCRPRYHDTASQRTLASSKMQTGYFSACMPACFRLLLMNHLARTHSFMYTHSFWSSRGRNTCFCRGRTICSPTAWKHRCTGSGIDLRFKFRWVFHLCTSSTAFLTLTIHLWSYLKLYSQPVLLWFSSF